MILNVTSYDLLRMPQKKGQYYYATDTRCIYKDTGLEPQHRIRVSAVIVNSDYERLNSVRPQNGQNYYVIDTQCLWMFDTRWVLKEGTVENYNSYIYNSSQPMTPVINVDSLITSPTTGDKILDNNGLTGDGSVVIRDFNRIHRGVIGADVPNSVLAFTSYMDNGISFYPYGMGAASENAQRIGSLHLGVDAVSTSSGDISLFNENLTHIGRADYDGNFYIHGKLCLVNDVDNRTYKVAYTPTESQQMIHSFTTQEEFNNKLTYRYIITKVLSATTAKVRIIEYTNTSQEVVIDDAGNPIYSQPTILTSDVEYDASRNILSSDSVKYTLEGPGYSFTLTGPGASAKVELHSVELGDNNNVFAETKLSDIYDIGKLLNIANTFQKIQKDTTQD